MHFSSASVSSGISIWRQRGIRRTKEDETNPVRSEAIPQTSVSRDQFEFRFLEDDLADWRRRCWPQRDATRCNPSVHITVASEDVAITLVGLLAADGRADGTAATKRPSRYTYVACARRSSFHAGDDPPAGDVPPARATSPSHYWPYVYVRVRAARKSGSCGNRAGPPAFVRGVAPSAVAHRFWTPPDDREGHGEPHLPVAMFVKRSPSPLTASRDPWKRQQQRLNAT